EEVRSRRHIDFPAFSLVNQFSPAEDHGLFVNGRAAGGLVEYGLAAYNGTGASDTNASKDLAARVMVHPFLDEEASLWRNFQIGVAGTVGKQEASTKGVTLDNEAGGAVVHFADDSFLDGDRTRLGLELAWYRGPWFAQAEYLAVAQDMRAGAAAPTEVGFRGAYVTLSRVLTGENKTYGGVDPDQPFDLKTGHGRGAWVLALRLSQLESDDDLEALGLASPGRFTDELRSASIGLNWIPNGHIIVRHALILSDYGQPVMLDRGLGDDEVSLMIEFQLHF
ncbi:MAG: porin, partial [Planctomycetota bacterium]|nr:porin [Planctomycetota bacterium]